MGSVNRMDDVIIISSSEVDQDNLVSVLKSAFDRASELATRHSLVAPLRLTLTDADGRCLTTVTMDCDQSGWTGQTEPGELDMRGGIAFPWRLVLTDGSGTELRIRFQLDPAPRVM